MRGQTISFYFSKLAIVLVLFLTSKNIVAQFDTEFWMPPIWQVGVASRNAPSSLFITVMAMENNTTVTFQTPFTMYDNVGALANPYTVTLQAGQSYLIRGNSPTQHVAGAHVTSNKDIAVISGSTHTRISGAGANAADGGTDQLVPLRLARN